MQYGSAETLVVLCQRSRRNSKGHPNGGAK